MILRAEIEQWKAKAALLESRNKELVQKKSGMFEELQHVRERQEALGEHNHKLLDEARINSQLINGLQEKVALFSFPSLSKLLNFALA